MDDDILVDEILDGNYKVEGGNDEVHESNGNIEVSNPNTEELKIVNKKIGSGFVGRRFLNAKRSLRGHPTKKTKKFVGSASSSFPKRATQKVKKLDMHDVLEMDVVGEGDHSSEPQMGFTLLASKPKKTNQPLRKCPEGVDPEAFALMLGSGVADIESLMPSALKDKEYRQKVKLNTGPVRHWEWRAFTNPARSDGLQLHHWERVGGSNPQSYRFAQFNKVISVPTFTDEEYEACLKSSTWTKADTQHLFDLCTRFDLRWIVIASRWEGSTPRSVEQLKERYYNAVNELSALCGISPTSPFCYDAEHETRRKEQLEKLSSRTPEQVEEEQQLIAELKKIEARKRVCEQKAQSLQKLMLNYDCSGEPLSPRQSASPSSLLPFSPLGFSADSSGTNEKKKSRANLRKATPKPSSTDFRQLATRVSTFTDDEYAKYLECAKWTKADTLLLFDQCTLVGTHWKRMAMQWRGSTPRTPVELKNRFHGALHKLLKKEEKFKTEEEGEWMNKTMDFELEVDEVENRIGAVTVHEDSQSNASLDQSTFAPFELSSSTPLISVSSLPSAARVKLPKKRRRTESTRSFTPFGTPTSEMKLFRTFSSRGVHMRSEEMEFSNYFPQWKFRNVNEVVRKFGFEVLPMGAEEIVTEYNELRSDIVVLLKLKEGLQMAEFDLESLNGHHKRLTGKALEIEPRMRVSMVGCGESLFGSGTPGAPTSKRTYTDILEVSTNKLERKQTTEASSSTQLLSSIASSSYGLQ